MGTTGARSWFAVPIFSAAAYDVALTDLGAGKGALPAAVLRAAADAPDAAVAPAAVLVDDAEAGLGAAIPSDTVVDEEVEDDELEAGAVLFLFISGRGGTRLAAAVAAAGLIAPTPELPVGILYVPALILAVGVPAGNLDLGIARLTSTCKWKKGFVSH